MMTPDEIRHIGEQFLHFARFWNGESVRKKRELKRSYTAFKDRDRREYPDFASVLFALEQAQIIRIRGEDVTVPFRVGQTLNASPGNVNKNSRALRSRDPMAQAPDQWHIRRVSQQRRIKAEAARASLQLVSMSKEVVDRDKTKQAICEELKKNRSKVIADKNGICLTANYPFKNGKIVFDLNKPCECKISLYVENTRTNPVSFTSYFLLDPCKHLSLSDEQRVSSENQLLLQPGSRYKVLVSFSWSGVQSCFYQAQLAFVFQLDQQPSTAPFYIVRFIDFHFMTPLGRELTNEASDKPRSHPTQPLTRDWEVKYGQRPQRVSGSKLKTEVPLKYYEIPWYMNDFIKSLKEPSEPSLSLLEPSADRKLLENPLCWKNYTKKLKWLLYLEELQMGVDIKRYNIPNAERDYAVMEKGKYGLLVMKLPDLSENRPSVLPGDMLKVYPEGGKRVIYCVFVHSVQRDSVKLSFHKELLENFQKGMKFSVEFSFSRLTLQIQHRAAELARKHGLEKVLFPDMSVSSDRNTELPQLKWFNSKVKDNQEQRRAVQHIVAGSSRPAPYLIFGPPGTGKTVTMVEAILQIEKTQASCHILACAHTNSAVDLLCNKILEHEHEVHEVLRMYAKTYDPNSVSDKLKKYTNQTSEGFDFPEKETLMEYKIIVTTLYTASRLVTGGIPAGHFTHVFVDEAGHATESECVIPLAGLLNPESGQVVLAGDPKQLGPIVRSPLAKEYGMGVSLLERLMDCVPENRTDSNCFLTKLLQNYRSHPAILEIPNKLFYGGELKAYANKALCNSCCSWEELPQKDFPVIFHRVMGVEKREACSPSFFNIMEVEVLMDYVKKLLQTEHKNGMGTIMPEDIGIITPYKKQVLKVRKALQVIGKNSEDFKVGSVEEFQGLERKVILVSTVRSITDCLQIEKQTSKMDFIKDEKRFNVALTRAKALLIVVGNPIVLNTDKNWAKFIQNCKDNNSYKNPEEEDG